MGAAAGPLAPEYQSREVHLRFVEDQLLEAKKKMPNPPDTLIHHTAPADARIFLLCHTANANVTHSHRVSFNDHSDKNDGEDDG